MCIVMEDDSDFQAPIFGLMIPSPEYHSVRLWNLGFYGVNV